jgi:hypothetical protein
LGAGNLELEVFWAAARCIEPVEVRWVFRLAVEPTESPELYDFLLGSGVVLEDEGVDVFLGIIEGERELGRAASRVGGGALTMEDKFWDWCIDMRFIRWASVGEMVLAPKPVAWFPCPGMTEALLEEPGVPPVLLLRGDLGKRTDFLLPSGVSWLLLLLLLLLLVLAEKLVAESRGGWIDLTLVARVAASPLEALKESIEVRADESRSEAVEIRLGRLFWGVRVP